MESPQPLEAPIDATDPPAPLAVTRQEQLAARWQFPRRVLVLFAAFVAATVVICVLRWALDTVYASLRDLPGDPESTLSFWWTGTCWLPPQNAVGEMLQDRLPNTLMLLGGTLVLALALALIETLVAVWVHGLEERKGVWGSVLKALGRCWVFGGAAAPVFCLSFILILILAAQLGLLPAAGMGTVGDATFGDRIRALVLPALVLALFPATLTAQAVARQVTLQREETGGRLWRFGLLRGLGTLLGQTGGLIGTSVLVEWAFAWPGVGRRFLDATMTGDHPALISILGTYSVMILVGRLLAELVRWIERRAYRPAFSPQPEPTRHRRVARTVWVILTLALLLLPLLFALGGLLADPEVVARPDPSTRSAPPSLQHILGTDRLGRDVLARVLRGGMLSLAIATLVAIVVWLAAAPCGALTGYLASRGALWSESLADLLLLGADVLLFLPAVPAAVLVAMLIQPTADPPVVVQLLRVALGAAVVVLPRAVRVYGTLWGAAPERRKGWVRGLAGPGALFLGSLFAAFGIVVALELAGLGARPPLPSIGVILLEEGRSLSGNASLGLIAACLMFSFHPFVFYTAADGLAGYFHTKDALARLNE